MGKKGKFSKEDMEKFAKMDPKDMKDMFKKKEAAPPASDQ